MKKVITTLFCFFFWQQTQAQIGIKADNSAPISSAQLEVQSTNKAFYPPRMTTAQKNAIPSPQAGAVVYDTDLKILSYYNGSAWVGTSVSTRAISNGAIGDYQLGRMLHSSTSGAGTSVGCKVDASGNFYLIGIYASSLSLYNFDGTSPLTLNHAGGNESFIAKYNSAGVLLWSARLGGASNESVGAIALDATGVTVSGTFNSTPMTIYNGRATTATAETSWGTLGASGTNGFVVRYNTSGTVQWVARSTGGDYGSKIVSDGTHVYASFQGSTPTIFNGRTNSGAGETSWGSLTGTNVNFVVKYTIAAGAVAWVSPTTGSGVYIDDLSISGSSLYVLSDATSITFNSAITTAAGTPTAWGTMTAIGVSSSSDAFLQKVNASTGAVDWVARVGSGPSNQWGAALANDALGNVYASIVGRNSATFAIYEARTTSVPAEVSWGGVALEGDLLGCNFLIKYNATGNVQWATHLHGSTASTGNINGTGLAVDAQNNVYLSGTYSGGTLINAYNSKNTGVGIQSLAMSVPALVGSQTRGYFAKFNSAGKLEWLDRTTGAESIISHIDASPTANTVFGIGVATSAAPLLLGTQSATFGATGGDFFFFKYTQGN